MEKVVKRDIIDSNCHFVGDPILDAEARYRWPYRYNDNFTNDCEASSSNSKEEENFAKCHYRQVDVIKFHKDLVDKKCVFISELTDDNPLDCIAYKLKIVQVSPIVDLVAKNAEIPDCDFFFDMMYSPIYCTLSNLRPEGSEASSSTISRDASSDGATAVINETKVDFKKNPEMSLLDLFCGCGAMSTGLCLGAALSGVNLVTRWAVDVNKYTCESLRWNHPETEVRNESAESFLSLLKEWRKLCEKFSLLDTKNSCEEKENNSDSMDNEDFKNDEYVPKQPTSSKFEVEKVIGISYGHPENNKEIGLHFKVRRKGYGADKDTWEHITALKNCEERIRDFVTEGYKMNILPLSVSLFAVLVLFCGGPPCQGAVDVNNMISLLELAGMNELPQYLTGTTVIYDHRPLQLNVDDYQRVCEYPKKRDLPGLVIHPGNKVEFENPKEREKLPSGSPLIPDYAVSFQRGLSFKPFGRLWWDENISTVLTRIEPHNHAHLHPEQDRVLTVREVARLQGFPDYYRLFGDIKQRYIQVGNAVAVPVARALGYVLGITHQGLKKFSRLRAERPSSTSEDSDVSE
ncbi:DNA (cytosine-5)-methyltransferase [Thalictrum thalictroides]|uniref:DNA (cytosine-5-)-methyltransferase n=1 Tax=Thalictrum thalictroides TaxID=46969 RepID=A0A7J6WAT1_THATH|nr:DNA (cytosine-5)-methyltransferase [Thalictrum thalictroides]